MTNNENKSIFHHIPADLPVRPAPASKPIEVVTSDAKEVEEVKAEAQSSPEEEEEILYQAESSAVIAAESTGQDKEVEEKEAKNHNFKTAHSGLLNFCPPQSVTRELNSEEDKFWKA